MKLYTFFKDSENIMVINFGLKFSSGEVERFHMTFLIKWSMIKKVPPSGLTRIIETIRVGRIVSEKHSRTNILRYAKAPGWTHKDVDFPNHIIDSFLDRMLQVYPEESNLTIVRVGN